MKTRMHINGYYDKPKYQIITLTDWPFIMPCRCGLDGGKDIKDTYHYYAWRPGNHRGVDILGFKGLAIYATGSGTVYFRGYDEVYGNNVIIKHGLNHGYWVYTRYAHMNSINYAIQEGCKVVKGQTLGLMGSTGDSKDPHLHYETLIHGWMLPNYKMRAADPIPFLPKTEVTKRLIEDELHGIKFEESLR